VGLPHKRGYGTGQLSKILRTGVFGSWPLKETCRTNSDRRIERAPTPVEGRLFQTLGHEN